MKSKGKKIYYICFYDISKYKKENRIFSLAAVNKIDYLSTIISELGYVVNIISLSWTNKRKGFYKKTTDNLEENKCLYRFMTYGVKTKIGKFLRLQILYIQLFTFLLFRVKKNDIVLVYHSHYLAFPILLSKIIKKYRLILELEEVYSDVKKISKVSQFKEIKLIKYANDFIFPNKEMTKIKYYNNQPYLVINGDYRIHSLKSNKNNINRFEFLDNDLIHLVYSGSLYYKKGIMNAIECCKFLNEKYVLHILGSGTKNEFEYMKNEVKKSNETNKCKIFYEGVLEGEEYFSFLRKCQIGLCPQSSQYKYNDTSFPSKILSYLGCNLRVVSTEIEAVKSSSVGEILYYSKNSPEDIAKVVIDIDFSQEYNSLLLLKVLNETTKKDLLKMLEGTISNEKS